jgi:hypothetical protein
MVDAAGLSAALLAAVACLAGAGLARLELAGLELAGLELAGVEPTCRRWPICRSPLLRPFRASSSGTLRPARRATL